jgi:hypothetical protein
VSGLLSGTQRHLSELLQKYRGDCMTRMSKVHIATVAGSNFSNENFYPSVDLSVYATGREGAHAFHISSVAIARNSVREVNVYLTAAQAREFAMALYVAANGNDITLHHPMTDAEYLAHDGLVCPLCGSQHTTGEDIEVDGWEALGDVSCDDCGACWQDIYRLVGYHKTAISEA